MPLPGETEEIMVKSLLLFSLLAVGAMTTSTQSQTLRSSGKVYSDFDSYEDTLKAADELNKEIAEEGMILLKNDGTLPLHGNEMVSVFGVKSDSLIGGSANTGAFDTDVKETESVGDALRKSGFKVNPTLESMYKDDSSTIGNEVTTFNGKVEGSLELYNDAAFIVISREGGEGSDAKTVTSEVADAEDKAAHKDLATKTVKDASGADKVETYKHSLMFTHSEKDLIKYVKTKFSKIVVVLNTSNPIEIHSLKKDNAINAIIDISRPGKNGIFALGEIVKGDINPSGRLQDNWDADHTADPVWQNFGDNSQVEANTIMLDPLFREEKSSGSGGGGGFPSMVAGEETKNPEDYPYNAKLDGAVSYDGTEHSQNYYTIDYEEGIYTGFKYYETYYSNLVASKGIEEATNWYENAVSYPYDMVYLTHLFQ